MEKVWTASFPDYIFESNFLDANIARFYQDENRLSNPYKAFAFARIAIFISCSGLYGLVSFVAIQRTKEIGIRKVLGASTTGIVSLLSKDFLLYWYSLQRDCLAAGLVGDEPMVARLCLPAGAGTFTAPLPGSATGDQAIDIHLTHRKDFQVGFYK